MSETKELLRRGVSGFEPMPDAFERVLDRRDRKQRNQRVAAGVLGIAVFALAAIGLVRLFGSEPTPASQPRSSFEGTWISAGDVNDGGTQTMTVVVSAEGVVEVTVLEDVATVCGSTPSTMTGTGRIEDGIALVIPAPVYTCDDGSEPETLSDPPLEEQLREWTLFLDLQTDTLSDGVGGVWLREGTTENGQAPPLRYSLLDGEVTFAANDPPWVGYSDLNESPRTMAGLTMAGLEGFGSIQVVADPLPVGTGCEADAAPADAQAWAERILSDPDIEATQPSPIRIAGVEALQMDVAPAAGASICDSGDEPVLFNTSDQPEAGWRSQVGLWHRYSYRVYLLDIPEGSGRVLAVVVFAFDRDFDEVVEAAAPVLDSLEFHAP